MISQPPISNKFFMAWSVNFVWDMKPYVDISASFPVIITSELAVDYCKNNKVLSPSVR